MRVACVYVPAFPLAAWLRVEPELHTQAVVVVERSDPQAKVLAASPAAWRWGIAPGMRLAQARNLFATLSVRLLAPSVVESARAALLDVAASFSPLVEPGGDGIVYLGLAGLIGSQYASESHWATQLAACSERVGFSAHVAVASTKTAALLAAMRSEGVTVLSPTEEAAFLAPVPITALQPSASLLATLHRWGVHTIGQLATLPLEAIGTRLGAEGIALVRQARGEDLLPLQPRPCPVRFEESIEFDFGIEHCEALVFVLHTLLERLTARLEARQFVCAALELAWHLMGIGWEKHCITLAYPNNEPKALLAALRTFLERQTPTAPIDAVQLRARPEPLRPAQLDLFRPKGPAPAALATTLAQLATLCGSDRVGIPGAPATHRIDSEQWLPFGSPEAERLPTPPPSALPPLALRRFRPPVVVEVFCEREQPDFVRGNGLGGRVVSCAGPWRIRTEWWSEVPCYRDYYDVQLSDGGVYRLYREVANSQWFVDGVYD